MTAAAELARLRAEQAIAAGHFRGPIDDYHHKDGAWQSITDLLLEECFILREISSTNSNKENNNESVPNRLG